MVAVATLDREARRMATRTPSRPVLSEAQLAEMMALLKGSDTVELKLTVPALSSASAIRALDLDPLDAQIRQVIFFDTPDLALDKAGVVRARRIQGREGGSVTKLRPVKPEDVPPEVRRLTGFGVELDAIPGGFVCSGRLKCPADSMDIRKVLLGARDLRKINPEDQRALFDEHAPAGVTPDDLSALGPIFVLKLKWRPRELPRNMVAEMGLYPEGPGSSSSRRSARRPAPFRSRRSSGRTSPATRSTCTASSRRKHARRSRSSPPSSPPRTDPGGTRRGSRIKGA